MKFEPLTLKTNGTRFFIIGIDNRMNSFLEYHCNVEALPVARSLQ